jgi:hypothetical protein
MLLAHSCALRPACVLAWGAVVAAGRELFSENEKRYQTLERMNETRLEATLLSA